MSNDLQYVVRQLADMNLKKIARNVGLSYMTVYRIANGENTAPMFSTVKKLADYFRGKE